jgi:hypothetical protein
MPLSFGNDTSPLPWALLPGNNVGLGWYNVQRKRLKKFALQYLGEAPEAVAVLRSQGEADTSLGVVKASRAGFTELRVRLPVLNQYYTYSGQHGGTPDSAVLAKIKDIVLAWVTTNQPTGKPIDETNFEGLLRVIAARWTDFSSSEQASITAWMNALKVAKLNWSFTPLPGEGRLLYGNHYTHHFKVLLWVCQNLGDTGTFSTLLAALDNHAAFNHPFNNGSVTTPGQHAIVGLSGSEQRLDLNGNLVARFPGGHAFTVSGNTQGNNGLYHVGSSQYLSGSNKTRLFTVETLTGSGGGGTLGEFYRNDLHDMPRAATSNGESIDYIRRDALHYHQYNLEPWIEIALLEGGTRYQAVLDNAFSFLETAVLTPPAKHYEFAASTDSFDSLRWQQSRSEYLQPGAMYRPDKLARVLFAYAFFKKRLNSAYIINERLLSIAVRSNFLPSHWPYYFRWVFQGAYG